MYRVPVYIPAKNEEQVRRILDDLRDFLDGFSSQSTGVHVAANELEIQAWQKVWEDGK